MFFGLSSIRSLIKNRNYVHKITTLSIHFNLFINDIQTQWTDNIKLFNQLNTIFIQSDIMNNNIFKSNICAELRTAATAATTFLFAFADYPFVLLSLEIMSFAVDLHLYCFRSGIFPLLYSVHIRYT